MAGRIVPFEEVVDIVGQDSYVNEDSWEDDEESHLNALASAEDGTAFPLADVVAISSSFGRLIPQCKRDSLLVLDKDLAEDEVALNDSVEDLAEVKSINGVEASVEEDKFVFSGDMERSAKEDEVAEFGREHDDEHVPELAEDELCNLNDEGDFETTTVASIPTRATVHSESLTPSATYTATSTDTPDQVQRGRGRGRGRGGSTASSTERSGRQRSGGISSERGMSRGRGRGRGRGRDRGRGRGSSLSGSVSASYYLSVDQLSR